MHIRLSITGTDGNGGRHYEVRFGCGCCWVAFDSMPGDQRLYCGHTTSGAEADSRANEARQIAGHHVGTLTGPNETASFCICDYCGLAPAEGRVPAHGANVCGACYSDHHGPLEGVDDHETYMAELSC